MVRKGEVTGIPSSAVEPAEPYPIIPNITDEEAAALAKAELIPNEDLDALKNAIPREFHPKAIKKEYRLKAILWSAVLAIVMITGMIGYRNNWGSMVNNVLRMMSGQATETAGLPDGVGPTQTPEVQPPQESTTAPQIAEPAPTQETIVTPEVVPPSVDRLVYPANNLVNDETLCRNSAGSYRAVVEPILVDGLELFRITVVPLDRNGEKNIADMMLPVIDPAERVHDAAKCLEGIPNGDNEMTYYIPVNQSEKASLRDTSELKVVDRNNFYYYFPGLVIVDEKGEQHPSDEGGMGFVTFKNPTAEYTNTALSDLNLP